MANASPALLALYLILWYAFNVAYNIYNKKVLNVLPFPWTVATLQLGIGLLYIIPVWVLRIRKAPAMSPDQIRAISPAAVFHSIGHVCTVISLGAGSVSFTHIVKAAEPIFSTVLSAIILKSYNHPVVNLTLLPVVAGVAIASMKELSFTWVSFLNAMGSNTAFATRSIVSKLAIKEVSMGMADFYAVMTIISFLGVLPFALIFEGPDIYDGYLVALTKVDRTTLIREVLFCGLSYYLYNEVSYMALDNLNAVSHAVANTIKRVVILIASVFFFNTVMSKQSIIGSGVAILGVLLYSLAKDHYSKKAKAS